MFACSYGVWSIYLLSYRLSSSPSSFSSLWSGRQVNLLGPVVCSGFGSSPPGNCLVIFHVGKLPASHTPSLFVVLGESGFKLHPVGQQSGLGYLCRSPISQFLELANIQSQLAVVAVCRGNCPNLSPDPLPNVQCCLSTWGGGFSWLRSVPANTPRQPQPGSDPLLVVSVPLTLGPGIIEFQCVTAELGYDIQKLVVFEDKDRKIAKEDSAEGRPTIPLWRPFCPPPPCWPGCP